MLAEGTFEGRVAIVTGGGSGLGRAVALAATALVLLPGTAAADVTVAASHAASGARDVTITFRVTDDDPAVAVTRLEVFLPTVRPLLGVVPTAPTGCTSASSTTSSPTCGSWSSTSTPT